jgi:beta-lactamase class A
VHPLAHLSRACCLALALLCAEASAAPWADALKARVERIDAATPGKLGIYVKRLDTGETFSYDADRPWYLGSTSKLAVAIAVLQDVDAGRRTLASKLVLQEQDRIDGSGNLVWQQAGTQWDVGSLLKRMLGDSDNTAANLLIRSLGIDTLNSKARDYMGSGHRPLTNFAQVRYDVYAQLHPKARQLPNLELVKLAAAPLGPARVDGLVRMLSIKRADLQVQTIDEAYARYYATGVNSATLSGYGAMLENLVRGKLLQPATLQGLLVDLKFNTYDAYRLEAGLPREVRFVHKTGTQYRRACHMGVINPQELGRAAIVVAACAEDLDEHAQAGPAFQQLGQAITETLLPGLQPGKR